MNKPTDEWGTPQWLFDLLDREFAFDLDVCASALNHKGKNYYGISDDGLASPWGYSNWCNPPYSNQWPWVERADYETNIERHSSVMLLKHDQSTAHGTLASKEADEIRVIEHRLTFEGAPNSANFPSAIAVFRPRLFTRKTDARILYVNFKPLLKGNK